MSERRSRYEIYWEILVFCKVPRSFTGIINRCDLNSKTGQEYVEFLTRKGYLSVIKNGKDGEKIVYAATDCAADYITLFSRLYQTLFDEIPGFKL